MSFFGKKKKLSAQNSPATRVRLFVSMRFLNLMLGLRAGKHTGRNTCTHALASTAGPSGRQECFAT